MPTLMTLIRQLDVRRAQVSGRGYYCRSFRNGKRLNWALQWALAKPDQVGAITSFSGSGPNLIPAQTEPTGGR